MYFTKKDNKFSLTMKGKNAVAGYVFILPFIIGFLAFMLIPLFESLRMVFSRVEIDIVRRGFFMTFTGFSNLNRVLFIDPEFNRLLVEEIARMSLIVPAVIFFSLFIALILNQEFKARALIRAIFFLPVIISSGILIGLETNNSLLNSMSQTIKDGNLMRTSITGILEEILATEGAMDKFMPYVFRVINQIYDIAMASAIQIIIFLSALQTIPASVFESAKIEGATKWECFWKITFPMISSLILVNIIYSVIDYFLRTDNRVMEKINTSMMMRLEFGFASAMAWIYFFIVLVFIGIVLGIISKKVYYYE